MTEKCCGNIATVPIIQKLSKCFTSVYSISSVAVTLSKYERVVRELNMLVLDVDSANGLLQVKSFLSEAKRTGTCLGV